MTTATTKVTSGAGPTCEEIAKAVTDGFNAMASGGPDPTEALWERYWSEGVVSIEGTGDAFHGKEAMKAKCAAWEAEHEILRCDITHTFVGPAGFTLVFDMEVKVKATGDTIKMIEAGVYEVQDGKVVRETFMYGPGMGG